MAGANQNNSTGATRSYDGGLNTDIKDYHSKSNAWTYALNASPNSITGDFGDLGNESANALCTLAPYTIIGLIYLYGNTWQIMSTDDTNSEIGIFDESVCTYTKIVNDPCLGFKRTNLITGVSKENFDCSWHTYWADGLNPDRTMNAFKPPFIQNCVTVNNCVTCTDTTQLDCDKIRLARLVQAPCVGIKKGASGGSLPNGSYMATVAYVINGQRVTDYFTLSPSQALFQHDNVAGSIDVIVTNLDKSFDEYELVVISVVNQQTQAKRIGVYSTRQSQVTLDIIDNKLIDVPLEFIPLHNPVIDKSDSISEVGSYLLRIAPTEKFDFNYQLLANNIVTKYQVAEYPASYYRKGGNNPSFLRDENYALFIQWEYNDGDLSSAYHIPGRGPFPSDLVNIVNADSQIEQNEGITPVAWSVINTATLGAPSAIPTGDGGFIIREGLMGYWESTELYPDNKPNVYGALCGQPIRHHKFPEQSLSPDLVHFIPNSSNINGPAIRILGVKFENISPPVDNAGNLIPGIVGYRILRGSREGNKTIVAKGIINNLWQYNIEGGTTSRQGLYPNYPYNDVQHADSFISTVDTSENFGVFSGNKNPTSQVRQDMFTFHSPDTQFRNPFLSMEEIKVYGELIGNAEGRFVTPDKHPRHKFLTDVAFIMGAVAGMGLAAIAMNGTRRTTSLMPRKTDFEDSGTIVLGGPGSSGTGLSGFDNPTTIAFDVAATAAVVPMLTDITAANALMWDNGGQLAGNVIGTGTDADYTPLLETAGLAGLIPGMSSYTVQVEQEAGAYNTIPAALRLLNSTVSFVNFWSQGTDASLNLIRALIKWEQHALQYQSQCFYEGWVNPQPVNHRRQITDSVYLKDQLQDYGTSFRINNLFRGHSVAVSLQTGFANTLVTDNTKQSVGDRGIWTDPHAPFATTAASHYAALKNRLRNQYGQLGGIQQIPIGCGNPVTVTTPSQFFVSPVIFGGDTYVTRYTEKNTMFFFYDWLYDQPDGYEFNYHLKKNVPFPMFWMNTELYDAADFISGLGTGLTGGGWNNLLPSGFHAFDRDGIANGGIFGIHDAYMYLFNSGVRDFYVESEVNTEFRDWGNIIEQRFYDPARYTDLPALFNSKTIKAVEQFMYDYSLSVGKSFINFISWANIQPINYDPDIYATCYTKYPHRVIYSLPQQFELIKDYWLVYPANNYRDFKTNVVAVKPINKSGAMLFFDTESPIQFVGVDELVTGAGTKITLGDGQLFNTAQQNLMTTDRPYEYGSCQNSRSIISTPMGIFYMSQNQGKIFQIENGIQEISMTDLKWWFAQYLPYALVVQFPTFQLIDNPVVGIGCQAIYDNENTLVYFTKRDYKLKSGFFPTAGPSTVINSVQYISGIDFLVGGILPIKLGDPTYFEDASWTMSYDPKTKNWVGWHDWKPELCVPGKNTFLTTQTDKGNGTCGLWVHNNVCDLYCNYYGVDYNFEVEYRVNTVQQETTLRSVECQVEVYKYATNCHDRYLEVDTFFDEAIVTNNEQTSGLLLLNNSPYNDPWATIGYPKYNANSVDILYSRVENRYRFNMIVDLTDDRGQFTMAQRMIWNTPANGYTRVLNPANINYAKDPFQHKKIRGYTSTVLLRKKISGNEKFLILLTNNKELNSPR